MREENAPKSAEGKHLLSRLLETTNRVDDPGAVIRDLLRALRLHLGMEVGFVSRLTARRRVFEFIDASTDSAGLVEGTSDEREDSFCHFVASGEMPELIRDARIEPRTRDLVVTWSIPIGAHLSVPLRLGDGSVYGTLCCFSRTGDRTLGQRDLTLARAIAEVVAGQIERRLAAEKCRRRFEADLDATLAGRDFNLVCQPIAAAPSLAVIGHEVLTRFSRFDGMSTQEIFQNAATLDGGEALTWMLARALRETQKSAAPGGAIFVNLAPDLLRIRALVEVLAEGMERRLVIELTEHAAYAADVDMLNRLRALRTRGVRIAMDDVGTGYSSFETVDAIRPDFLKIAGSLVAGVATNRGRATLIGALARFAREIGAATIAEGVECEEDLEALRGLDVGFVQGRLIGPPTTFATAPRSDDGPER